NLTYLVGKVFHDAQRRVRRRLTQAADRGVHHGLRELLKQRLVPLARLHEPERLGGAYAAGGALAAGLLLEELHQVPCRGRSFVFVRKNYNRRGADEAAERLQGIEVERYIAL